MIVAIYSPKGGVGKTTLAVNLAWASAILSRRRTLLWDLDAQAAASFLLGVDAQGKSARSGITGKADASEQIEPSTVEGIDILPADDSLRALDHAFRDLGKRKRLAKIAAELAQDYERIVIDCPPGLTDTTDQILRAAGIVVVPVVPSAFRSARSKSSRNMSSARRAPR